MEGKRKIIKRRKFHLHGFSVHYDGLIEMGEERIEMLMFVRDINRPRVLRRHPSYLTPQMII